MANVFEEIGRLHMMQLTLQERFTDAVNTLLAVSIGEVKPMQLLVDVNAKTWQVLPVQAVPQPPTPLARPEYTGPTYEECNKPQAADKPLNNQALSESVQKLMKAASEAQKFLDETKPTSIEQQTIERCAQLCEAMGNSQGGSSEGYEGECAAAIRRLKSGYKPNTNGPLTKQHDPV